MQHSEVLQEVTQGALLNTHIHARTKRTIYGCVRLTTGLLIKINEVTSQRHSETDASQRARERKTSITLKYLLSKINCKFYLLRPCIKLMPRASNSCQEHRTLFKLISNWPFFSHFCYNDEDSMARLMQKIHIMQSVWERYQTGPISYHFCVYMEVRTRLLLIFFNLFFHLQRRRNEGRLVAEWCATAGCNDY